MTDRARLDGARTTHVFVAGLVGIVIGVIDGLWARREGLGADGVIASVAILGTVGAVLGLLQALALHGARLIGRRIDAEARVAKAVEEAGGREAVMLELHAEVVAVLLSLAIAAAPMYVVAVASGSIQLELVRIVVIVVAGVGTAAIAFVARAVLLRLARAVFKRIHRRLGLPRPRSRTLQFALYVLVPITLVGMACLYVAADTLGPVAYLIGFAIFAAWQILVNLLGIHRLPRNARLIGLALVAATALGGLVHTARWGAINHHTRAAVVAPRVLPLFRTITDFDRDGFSAYFGGGDCAPFDAQRSPGARDVAGNGIDEDCSGADSDAANLSLTAFSDVLTPKQKRKYNVLFVVADSVRPDHMSAYGYAKDTTPFLKSLAKTSWLFDAAYSQSTATSLSMPSMFSGRHPASIDWKKGKYYPQPVAPFANLPRLLTRHGYDTTIVVNYRMKVRMPGVTDGHEHVAAAPKGVSWKSGGHLVGLTIQAIERARAAKKPFYIAVHLDDVHVPYKGGVGRAVPALANRNRDITKFDRGIAMTDHYMQAMVAHLQNVNAFDSTIIIYTADHGEAFGEHGEKHHGFNCNEEQSRVPLIARVPKMKGKRIDARVGLVDIVPTIAELIGLDASAIEVDGQSLLVPALAPERLSSERPVRCYIHRLFQKRPDYFIESVRSGRFHFHRDVITSKTALYDLTADPKELKNLAEDAGMKAERERLEAILAASRTSNFYTYR